MAASADSLAYNDRLERNLRIYPWYQAACGFLPWLPVFFLYFLEFVSLPEALRLSAVYYVVVVVLEVPSGYCSDRLGRRPTLLLSTIFAALSYLCFLAAGPHYWLVAGQCLLAGFMSLKSGSDNALLFDTLNELDKQHLYPQHEVNSLRFNMASMAIAALLGGFSGLIDLRWPYFLAFLAAVSAIALSYQFVEPRRLQRASPFFTQVRYCISRLKDPLLLWLFLFSIVAFVLVHVIAEFNQPMIRSLDIDWFRNTDLSPLISGVIVTLSMSGGVIGASISLNLLQRFGLQRLLLGNLALMIFIVSAMRFMLNPLVLVFVMLRNLPMAVIEAPIQSAIAPKLEAHYRATYLSIQSLSVRLCFGLLLYMLGVFLIDNDVDSTNAASLRPDVDAALTVSLFLAIAGLLVLWLVARISRDNA